MSSRRSTSPATRSATGGRSSSSARLGRARDVRVGGLQRRVRAGLLERPVRPPGRRAPDGVPGATLTSTRFTDGSAPPLPAATPDQTSESHVSAASTTWNQTIPAGSSIAYCAGRRAPGTRSARRPRSARCCSSGRHRVRGQEPGADRGEAEQRRQRAVLVDRPVERLRAPPVEPRHDVAGARAARVRTRRRWRSSPRRA